MAAPMQTIAYFRARMNAGAPLFEAKFAHDAEAMRKHADYFECDKTGKALDGVSVAMPKYVPGEPLVEEAVEVAAPAPAPAPAAKGKRK